MIKYFLPKRLLKTYPDQEVDTTKDLSVQSYIVNTVNEQTKELTGLITQSGTDAPTLVVLKNTTGVTPTTAYMAVGSYSVICTGVFTANKTAVFVENPNTLGATAFGVRDSANSVLLNSTNASNAAANGLFTATPFRIVVYK